MTDPQDPPAKTPVLLSSRRSAALLDGRGDLELTREMRGAPAEWGGVIGQCVRLTGPWRLALRSAGVDGDLPGALRAAETGGGRWRSLHRWNGFEFAHSVAALERVPGVLRTLRCAPREGPPGTLTVTSYFEPFLLPVLVEGIRPRYFRVDTGTDELRVRQRGFGLSVRSNVAPSLLFLNRGSWIGGHYRGRVDEIGVEYSLPVAPDAPSELRILVTGGLDRDLDPAREEAARALADPDGAAAEVDQADRDWTDATPTLRFPDAPALERGYARARSALRRLYCAPGDGLTGLVAGFPWYAALWGRDVAWMLWAVVWLGDFDWARRSIDTIVHFQSHANVPVLAGEAGELPMQISPGPVFFYGTSDTTLYFPLLMRRWVEHAGASQLPVGWPDAVRGMIGWGEARCDPATGLLRNGGEVETISAATGSLARVRYGIDAPDTTIWDSTDRRSHAIDLQVLWTRALDAAAEIVPGVADGTSARWRAAAERVARAIRTEYVWDAEGYLYDTVRNGRPVPQLRPNALRAVSAALLPPDLARRCVARAARDDLTTPWGVRTLSSGDPGYRPDAYHDGQVWTIATAWAADAALAVGDADRGVAYLTTIADRYEAGGANECYRGDAPVPYDSCFLLGFSVAPFLTVLFERLWGLAVDARSSRLRVRTTFPARWTAAAIDNLKIGDGTVALDWSPERLRVRWFGPRALTVDAGAGDVTVAPGASADVPLPVRS